MNILFKELNLLKQTKEALQELNFANPTPIQALVIPEMINGNDIIAQSQTGTGKTFSFSIPIIEKINPKIEKTQSLILCPTRELSMQVFDEIKKLLKFYKEIRIALICGGESYTKQFQILEKKPHIIIATPGRIIDLLEKKKVDISEIKILTLDEADEMLKMGFQEALETILKNIPEQRQTVLFSATLPLTIKKIAFKYQKNPKILKIKQDNIAVKSIKQFYFIIKEYNKNKLLVRLLDQKNLDSVIIFANTKKDVDNIFNYLQNENFLVNAIHGDLKQNQRKYVMDNFRKKNIKILVATDVAARGLDISDVKMIINYDLPHEDEVYVHRIGRTGRAGKDGLAYSFISYTKINRLKKLEYYLKDKITFLNIPTIEEIQKEQNSHFYKKIKKLIEKEEIVETKENEILINDLLDKFEARKIINSFVQYFRPKKKNYEPISDIRQNTNYKKNNIIENKFRTKFNNKNTNFLKKRENMEEISINLGKKDGINNPLLLLKIMDEKFHIYKRNIGNIKHYYEKTIFEISKNLVEKIKYKNNVYFENKLLKITSFK
ncbi:DEAD/DEAH box helicase family protein [Candidatus Phytoplasma oryzae]|uniref:DEAD/DEAH box helicase family protein n=1 Tax=Candidatus Phytoplasma oryzae TaxID=203274 RepID=A0A139JR23_9MOLU|nr:DEAD/DEAH box helicase [Candidatus Phytoplasma oryzae]KXT29437.1 DEAD/DEAH box helicase family protein [Candidatus Phytoplasma oryzae]RAM58018.1 DNA helicase [Candidatus Phytoplasma oryzae]